jgi:hypothetical protein
VDWHQTAPFVIISIFAKLALPDKSFVETNKVSTKVKLVFEGGKKQFKKNFVLHGVGCACHIFFDDQLSN